MAAIFLSTTFPHMNYFWGGGHDKISEGLDPTWGTPKVVTAAGSDTTGTKQPNSLDCSGYISWSLKKWRVRHIQTNGNGRTRTTR